MSLQIILVNETTCRLRLAKGQKRVHAAAVSQFSTIGQCMYCRVVFGNLAPRWTARVLKSDMFLLPTCLLQHRGALPQAMNPRSNSSPVMF